MRRLSRSPRPIPIRVAAPLGGSATPSKCMAPVLERGRHGAILATHGKPERKGADHAWNRDRSTGRTLERDPPEEGDRAVAPVRRHRGRGRRRGGTALADRCRVGGGIDKGG